MVTTSPRVAQQANAVYGCVPFLLSEPPQGAGLEQVKRQAVEFARLQGLAEFVKVRAAFGACLGPAFPPPPPTGARRWTELRAAGSARRRRRPPPLPAPQGDSAGDQLLAVTGPPGHPFICDEDLSEVEYLAEVLGDEACKLVHPSGGRQRRAAGPPGPPRGPPAVQRLARALS